MHNLVPETLSYSFHQRLRLSYVELCSKRSRHRVPYYPTVYILRCIRAPFQRGQMNEGKWTCEVTCNRGLSKV